jgi:hypothetical protein
MNEYNSNRRRRKTLTPRPKVKIGGQWVAHQVRMIRVLRGLSLTARRFLDTVEIEHCRRGGRENGRLIVTYSDFERELGGNTNRRGIARAVRELEAAGIIKVRRGRRAFADLRLPSVYTLTFEPTYNDGKAADPTHDWKQKTGGLSTPGAGGLLTPGNGQKPGAFSPLREGESRGPFNPYYLDLGRTGGGGAADLSGPSPPPQAPPPEGMEPSALSLPTDELPSATRPSSERFH